MPVERQVTRPAEPAGRLLELACSQACGDYGATPQLTQKLHILKLKSQ
jgi:hypothetical protein